MPNRQFYTMKFKSSRLKEFGYNIQLTFEEAQQNGEIIALADNQILRSIRDIQKKNVYLDQLELWYEERDKLKKQKSSEENTNRIIELQNNIYNMMYIPEYITIVMEYPSHYKYLFENGLILNNKRYIRFSSSASQSRVSTVVFCDEEIFNNLTNVLDNGRNKNIKLAPSKFNAYKGLSGSATHVVSTPRFCVVPDYKEVMTNIKVNFVTETSYNEDDLIEPKEAELEFNRFDGQGLISYEQSRKWAIELGLYNEENKDGYIPSQWCVRQNFLKGMVCTFPFHEFCEEKNNKNYKVKTVYKDKDGNNILVDLRDVDVIISEGQFKLWDSFNSMKEYMANCDKNNLKWGISLFTPKEPKNILTMNYQFNQTLNWDKKDIEKVCKKTVDWINGVTLDNINYTLLFLLGDNISKEFLYKYLDSPKNYWVKSLMVNHDLIKDKYIKNKIYNLIKKRIKHACLGDILVDGNYQTLVSDPYAMMQHICGQKVTGLLEEHEYYSNYWNRKGIKVVDSMRAPLTFRSEHLKLNLVKNEKMKKWYRYCIAGIIVNAHGIETLHWAGSDYDYDQIATTSDKAVIDGVYINELPVVYDAPKPEKKILDENDLYNADLFAFGSIIGQITNKSTSGYALLPLFKEDNKEYETTMNRIKMCTKLQSAQIDKAKIGKEVKGIPKIWTEKEKIDNKIDSDEEIKRKELHNSLLLNKHPYFFIYLYSDTKRRYNNYVNGYDLSCKQKFGLSLDDLINKKRKKQEEQEFIDVYNKYLPVIDSNSVMNMLCKHIEEVDFDIKNKIRVKEDKEIHKQYQRGIVNREGEIYKNVLSQFKLTNAEIRDLSNTGINARSNSNKHDDGIYNGKNGIYESFKKRMTKICSNVYELTDYLVDIFYYKYPKSNKDLLWNTYGKYIFENVKLHNNLNTILFPIPNELGNIKYLNKKYKLEEVNFDKV